MECSLVLKRNEVASNEKKKCGGTLNTYSQVKKASLENAACCVVPTIRHMEKAKWWPQ